MHAARWRQKAGQYGGQGSRRVGGVLHTWYSKRYGHWRGGAECCVLNMLRGPLYPWRVLLSVAYGRTVIARFVWHWHDSDESIDPLICSTAVPRRRRGPTTWQAVNNSHRSSCFFGILSLQAQNLSLLHGINGHCHCKFSSTHRERWSDSNSSAARWHPPLAHRSFADPRRSLSAGGTWAPYILWAIVMCISHVARRRGANGPAGLGPAALPLYTCRSSNFAASIRVSQDSE